MEFEARTGEVWPLNVGQVYSTWARLERDGLVEEVEPEPGDDPRQRPYRITDAGRVEVAEWFVRPAGLAPVRDELVLKIMLASTHRDVDPVVVIQSERRAALILLQEYTRLKADEPDPRDLGWSLLLDSLVFTVEARVRWLDAADARIARHAGVGRVTASGDVVVVPEGCVGERSSHS